MNQWRFKNIGVKFLSIIVGVLLCSQAFAENANSKESQGQLVSQDAPHVSQNNPSAPYLRDPKKQLDIWIENKKNQEWMQLEKLVVSTSTQSMVERFKTEGFKMPLYLQKPQTNNAQWWILMPLTLLGSWLLVWGLMGYFGWYPKRRVPVVLVHNQEAKAFYEQLQNMQRDAFKTAWADPAQRGMIQKTSLMDVGLSLLVILGLVLWGENEKIQLQAVKGWVVVNQGNQDLKEIYLSEDQSITVNGQKHPNATWGINRYQESLWINGLVANKTLSFTLDSKKSLWFAASDSMQERLQGELKMLQEKKQIAPQRIQEPFVPSVAIGNFWVNIKEATVPNEALKKPSIY